jgi:hypothetical protein
MAIYRFKVSFEEYDEVNRIIEIKSTQTFLDFHNCIQESIKFDNKHAASFFVSDDYWRKNDEITLLEDDKDDDTKLMATTKIATHIEHPYQRFVYLYDKNVQWSFLIELIKIEKENPKSTYPTCVKSNGNAPKQYKQTLIKPDASSIQDPILAALAGGAASELLLDDELEDEAYNNANEEEDLGLNEGDLDFAQSEEGEEDESQEEEGAEEGEGSDEEYGFGNDASDDY